MATDEDIQSRLDRILTLVRAGMPISKATQQENCVHWFYRKISNVERGPIVCARREYVQMEKQLLATVALPPQTVAIIVELPAQRKLDFQTMCEQKGVPMSRRINTLIAADLNQNRSGFI